ncbi:Biotin carboxylase [Thermosyntropha lipolytica DSM 11003]|uniref:Biotin carboxylase n=1 Tax=Thermosyntropha lipolytica DSM 11003 TaxID=1123382 RepID=A0A1M5LKU5_9FIRM|nr:ATP-grasp domain-containing protein [Thermosyntropha lipolytica]SHG65520.1 Biotin carboxylase [Thermosyntropha lipolytica DSM 11003]
MKVLILGGGFMQLNAIRRAKAKGWTVVVSDYLPHAPGKRLADFAELVSTFDIEGNIEVALKHRVDAVFTIGTDQPVLTAAKVAETLNLPALISADTALKATNKKYMKKTMEENGIPSSRYILVKKEELATPHTIRKRLDDFNLPVVVKPLDSQGQRGVFKLYRFDEQAISYMQETFKFTRQEEIIVEEFCAGDEITVSAWVEEGIPYILMITDRPLLYVEPHLGIPDGHVFPSVYTLSYYDEIKQLVARIIRAFAIKSGPLYIQMIIGESGVKVVEIACRIGGGHEEELIPLVSGIDIVDMFLEKSVGNHIDVESLKRYNLLTNSRYAMVKFIIGQPGEVKTWASLERVKNMPGVINAGFYDTSRREIRPLTDSTCRIGYLLVEGKDRQELMARVKKAYDEVKVWDSKGNNMVVWFKTYA